MDMDQIIHEKQVLEERIFSLLDGFNARTGLNVCNVRLEILTINTLAEARSIEKLTGVALDVRLP